MTKKANPVISKLKKRVTDARRDKRLREELLAGAQLDVNTSLADLTYARSVAEKAKVALEKQTAKVTTLEQELKAKENFAIETKRESEKKLVELEAKLLEALKSESKPFPPKQ